jgi:hypothetical protein
VAPKHPHNGEGNPVAEKRKIWPQQSGPPDFDGAKVLLDEWKFRHQHSWTSLRQYFIAAVTISIVPYVKPDLIPTLGSTVLLFPLVGWLISVGAILLFAAEYVRCYDAEVQYHWLLGDTLPDQKATRSFKTLAFRSIGQTTIAVLFVMSWMLSVGNAIVLIRLLEPLGKAFRPFGVDFYACLVGISIVYFLVLALAIRHFRKDTRMERSQASGCRFQPIATSLKESANALA